MKTTHKLPNPGNGYTNGTFRQGYIRATYAELVAALGEPNALSDGEKTDAEWAFRTEGGVVATLYNWKNGPNFTGLGCVEDIEEWNIGGFGQDAVVLINALLGR